MNTYKRSMKAIKGKRKNIVILILFCFLLSTSSKAQDLLWNKKLTGYKDNYPVKSSIDSQNNIYIVGTFNGICDASFPLNTIGLDDIFIAKYDANGTLQWLKQIGSSLVDLASGVVISNDDKYIYITGYFQGVAYASGSSINSSGNIDGFLAKYKNNGDLVWFKNIASSTLATIQSPNEMKMDKNNHLVIGGQFYNDLILGDQIKNKHFTTSQPVGMFISQFDTSGTIIDAIKFESSNSSSRLYTLDVDTSGYYITSQFKNSLYLDIGTKVSGNNSIDMYIYKVNYDLKGQWFVKIGGTGTDQIFSCVTDNLGYIYIGGNFYSPSLSIDANSLGTLPPLTASNTDLTGTTSDIFFAKYNSSGVLQWFNTAGSSGNDILYRALYKNGNFIVAGQYSGTLTLNNQTITQKGTGDAFAIVHDSNDNLKYLIPIGGTKADIGQTAVVDNIGNFIVIGDYASDRITFNNANEFLDNSNTDNTRDMFIAKYDKASLKKISTNISCHGGSDGAIDLNPMGTVVAPFTFVWSKRGDPSFSANTEDLSGLNAGTYLVTFTDGIGYTKKDSVILTEPAALSANVSHTDATCFNGTNGTITVSAPSGGTLPYTYSCVGTGSGINATSQNQAAVSHGTYMVTIKDKNNCTLTLSNIVVAQPDAITFGGSVVTDIVTSPATQGAIMLAWHGGSGIDSTFAWTGPSPFTPATTRNLANLTSVGTYQVHVTSTKGCTGDTSFMVNDGTVLKAYIQSKQDVKCYSESTGSATAGVKNAQGTVTYLWDDAMHTTSAIVTGLAKGTYHVTVTDISNGHNDVAAVTIAEPAAALTVTGIAVKNITCHDLNDGILDASVNFGTKPYTYKWVKDGTDYATTEDITNLSPGAYSFTVTDVNSCTAVGSGSITNALPISINVVSVTPVTCEGAKNNGSIVPDSANGGTKPYNYQWSNGLNNLSISLLPVGSYTLTVTDAHNCKTTISKTVGYDSPMIINSLMAKVGCNGGNDGSISLSVTAGHSPFTYQWSNGASTSDISNLHANAYTVTVTDSKSCVKTYTESVEEPAALSINSAVVNNVSCHGMDDGVVDLKSVTGGISPYTYEWSGGGTPSGSKYEDLRPGNYSVIVKDTHFCEKTQSFTITEPVALSLSEKLTSHVDPKCNSAASGVVELQASGGNGVFQYTYNHVDWSDSPVFTGLAGGAYRFGVRDMMSVNCFIDLADSIKVVAPPALTLTENAASHVDLPCHNSNATGTVELLASGGNGVYQYSYNHVDWSDSPVFTGLAPDDYLFSVRDKMVTDCSFDLQDVISVIDPPALGLTEITASHADLTCYNSGASGIIELQPSGGSGAYQFTNNHLDWSDSPLFTGLDAGSYHFGIRDKMATDCSFDMTDSITITKPGAMAENAFRADSASCYQSEDGALLYTVTGGTAPLQYTLKLSGTETGNTTGRTNGNFINLKGSDAYTVAVTDANRCGPLTSSTLSVPAPAPITITKDSVADATSSSPWNGLLKVNVCGGSGTYTFTLNNTVQYNGIFGNLAPGVYTITITDEGGCGTLTSDALTVSTATKVSLLNFEKGKLYPNPVHDKLTVYFGEKPVVDDLNIEIISMNGKVMYKESVAKGNLTNNSIQLNLGMLPKGTYLLKVNGKMWNDKIIIQ
jgi:hypothetical protein